MHWLYEHRLLLTIYAAGIALAISELSLPEDRSGDLDSPQAFLKPDINVADVSHALYPDRALTLYYRAFRASLCSGTAAQNPPECQATDPVEPGEVRELIERSLATGNRSIEMAMYNYAIVLIQENAPTEVIDAAIRNWRAAYPTSERPDPRAMVREMRGKR